MHDDDFEDLTPRWWLDHDEPIRAAELLKPGHFVETSPLEHAALTRELARRGLACTYEDGGSWVWTLEEARKLERERRNTPASTLAITRPLEGGQRKPPKPGAETLVSPAVDDRSSAGKLED